MHGRIAAVARALFALRASQPVIAEPRICNAFGNLVCGKPARGNLARTARIRAKLICDRPMRPHQP